MADLKRAGQAGLAFDIAKKLEDKRDYPAEGKALRWMTDVVGHQPENGSGSFDEALRDGVFLCECINAIKPNSVKKIRKGTVQAFAVMQNIDLFQRALLAYGMRQEDIFQTVDLHEKRNIPSVMKTIYALARHAASQGYRGPSLEMENPKFKDY